MNLRDAPPDFFPHSQKEMISLDGVGSCDSESSSCSPEIGSQGRKMSDLRIIFYV